MSLGRKSLQVSDQQLLVESQRIECCGILSIAGELDLATVDQVDQHIALLVNGDALAHLLIDMVGLTFMDSTGLKALLRASEHVNGRAALIAPNFAIRRIFEVTGLDDQFPQFPDLGSAQVHFHSTR